MTSWFHPILAIYNYIRQRFLLVHVIIITIDYITSIWVFARFIFLLSFNVKCLGKEQLMFNRISLEGKALKCQQPVKTVQRPLSQTKLYLDWAKPKELHLSQKSQQSLKCEYVGSDYVIDNIGWWNIMLFVITWFKK